MKRREFIKVVGGAASGYAVGVKAALGAESSANTPPGEEKVEGMPRRVLGRTGQKVSMVGFPGLALANYDQKRGTAALHKAFDEGINYFDVAPAYGNGDAEVKMGVGLEGIDRSRIFLACKTNKRDKETARMELERSLKRLKTDHFDLYQLHHLRTPEEVKKALGPDGAMETILKAKEEGKVRYIGFSAHTTKGALEAMKGFRFDTCMFPINFIEFYQLGFGKPVLELANEQGVAVISIKPMCRGGWPQGVERTRNWWYRPIEDQLEANLAIRFVFSQPGVVAGIPASFLDTLERMMTAAKAFRPINDAEIKVLQTIASNCTSIFQIEEQRVAKGMSHAGPVYAESPHEHTWRHGA
jgi:predicted aldo/keto reductase-like oxidoreductase